ncbi:MAG: cyanoexosortase A system-associated protein [Cyanobacteria bacterium P01_F01_bin.150]
MVAKDNLLISVVGSILDEKAFHPSDSEVTIYQQGHLGQFFMGSTLPTSESPPSESSTSFPSVRQILLGVNVAIAAIVLGKSLLDPSIGKPRSFELPESVELEAWVLTNSEELDSFSLSTGESDYSDEGHRYTYRLAPDHVAKELSRTESSGSSPAMQATLTIEMRYMIDTNGFIERLLMGHQEFQRTLTTLEESGVDISTIEADVQYQSGIGYSGWFQIEDTTYLSACINPRGESTFFIDQFLDNQSIYDRDPTRLLQVLFGRQTWTDQRCLWTHMTLTRASSGPKISSNASQSPSLQALLDETWAEWYGIWQPKFPNR